MSDKVKRLLIIGGNSISVSAIIMMLFYVLGLDYGLAPFLAIAGVTFIGGAIDDV